MINKQLYNSKWEIWYNYKPSYNLLLYKISLNFQKLWYDIEVVFGIFSGYLPLMKVIIM